MKSNSPHGLDRRASAPPRRRSRPLRLRLAWGVVSFAFSLAVGSLGPLHAASTHPYYRRTLPTPQPEAQFSSTGTETDLLHTNTHLPAFPAGPVDLALYNARYDARAAAAVRNAAGLAKGYPLFPTTDPEAALLEETTYKGHVDSIYHLTPKNLALMAYPDYFPTSVHNVIMRASVSLAVLNAKPGWCGTFGPGVEGTDLLDFWEGNYEMGQMYLLPLIYRYYDELSPEAREHLINELLQRGTVHRPGEDDTNTSGAVPTDWTRAGLVPIVDLDIGETENHILMILTARYLTNQLLYQRDRPEDRFRHDNRRNGNNGGPACTDLVLALLRNILRNDFSEYNAKNYQEETRRALVNLAAYAYDHEVRLAARLVLDYISAHLAVSSCDARRLVPFRRLNDGVKVTRTYGVYMGVGLVETSMGADPMTPFIAMQSGNTRAYEGQNPNPIPGTTLAARLFPLTIPGGGKELTMEMLSDYRLPPLIHDLFVNDPHRRFFQRLHRTPQDEAGGNRNTDNLEIYAGSPSYLITAGGAAAHQAIPAVGPFGNNPKDRGVAMTTSFMPTGQSAGPLTQNQAWDLIQFGFAADLPGEVDNYGVAPDFACGRSVYLPPWVSGELVGGFLFVNRAGPTGRPGFYLAIYQQTDGLTMMEAFDTWRHPGVTIDQFRSGVLARNSGLILQNNVEAVYTTQNGNRIRFVIWRDGARDGMAESGALVLNIDYPAGGDPLETLSGAGNDASRFLSGTVLDSPAEAVVRITHPAGGGNILLDLNDRWHPRRISETGELEQAGFNNEVWVDFDWDAESEGDFFRPFKSLAAARDAVADGGTIRITPGRTPGPIQLAGKRMRLVAPIGGVTLGLP
jgi:hypothetical protein